MEILQKVQSKQREKISLFRPKTILKSQSHLSASGHISAFQMLGSHCWVTGNPTAGQLERVALHGVHSLRLPFQAIHLCDSQCCSPWLADRGESRASRQPPVSMTSSCDSGRCTPIFQRGSLRALLSCCWSLGQKSHGAM